MYTELRETAKNMNQRAEGKEDDKALNDRHAKGGFWQKIIQVLNRLGPDEETGRLGDFTLTPRVFLISLMAIAIGIISSVVALILLRLIGLITNLTFFGRWSTVLVTPAGNRLGVFEILVPVAGSIVVGFIARYGTERIRGHGIPEAIESILMNGSKVSPKVAILKPIASAITIGTGGPFGAEGPIIMTGGAFGSMIAQFFHLSSSERKTLLVAGAAAGMAAVFFTPIAAVLLAVELMLFEWKPRSLIPVILASAVAATMRWYIIGPGPLFPVPVHPVFVGVTALLGCLLVGLLAGILASLLTISVYASEDIFHRLPLHWMWWPAIGGVAIGIGGLIFPSALGVGYNIIDDFLTGNYTLQLILGILIVKSIIWAFSLSSGTSGGVLAPILMIGGALGGLEALFLPNLGLGFWPLISMAAVLAGALRSPFTAIIFSLELTHDVNALLPLLVAVCISYAFSVLFMRRSILTEKISRRGYHLSSEYAIDPLEIIFVREVMRTKIVALPTDITEKELAQSLSNVEKYRGQHLFPIVDAQGNLNGVVTRKDIQRLLQHAPEDSIGIIRQNGGSGSSAGLENSSKTHWALKLNGLVKTDPVVAYPDEPMRVTVSRMAESGLTRMPVVERDDTHKLVGMVSLNDLLKARSRVLDEERKRERILRIRFFRPNGEPRTEITRTLKIPNSLPEEQWGADSNEERVRD
jgi:CIC family chloride channel protein